MGKYFGSQPESNLTMLSALPSTTMNLSNNPNYELRRKRKLQSWLASDWLGVFLVLGQLVIIFYRSLHTTFTSFQVSIFAIPIYVFGLYYTIFSPPRERHFSLFLHV